MRFSEVLWEVVGSDGFVSGHYGLMVRSWRLSSPTLCSSNQHLSLTHCKLRCSKRAICMERCCLLDGKHCSVGRASAVVNALGPDMIDHFSDVQHNRPRVEVS